MNANEEVYGKFYVGESVVVIGNTVHQYMDQK